MERAQPSPALWIKIWIFGEERPLDELFACALRMWIMDLEYCQCCDDENFGNLSPRRLDLTKWREPWSSWAGSDSGIFCISIIRANSPFGLWRLSILFIVLCYLYSASFNCISGSWSVCISESLIFPFSFFLIISSLSSPLLFHPSDSEITTLYHRNIVKQNQGVEHPVLFNS